MVRNTVLTAQSGLNAELSAGRLGILVASDSQAKLKDFISPIIAGNGTPRSSPLKFRRRNFILMDRLSIISEWTSDEKTDMVSALAKLGDAFQCLLRISQTRLEKS